jgi:hypothetical protein
MKKNLMITLAIYIVFALIIVSVCNMMFPEGLLTFAEAILLTTAETIFIMLPVIGITILLKIEKII